MAGIGAGLRLRDRFGGFDIEDQDAFAVMIGHFDVAENQSLVNVDPELLYHALCTDDTLKIVPPVVFHGEKVTVERNRILHLYQLPLGIIEQRYIMGVTNPFPCSGVITISPRLLSETYNRDERTWLRFSLFAICQSLTKAPRLHLPTCSRGCAA